MPKTPDEKKAAAIANTKRWRAANPDKVAAYNAKLTEKRRAAKAAA